MTNSLARWAAAAAVRAVKTAAQSALGIIGASVALGEVDWALVASAAALAAIVSALSRLAQDPAFCGTALTALLRFPASPRSRAARPWPSSRGVASRHG